MRKLRSLFKIDRVTEDTVYLIDLCEEFGTMSVTNDAEAVVQRLHEEFGDRRFVYLDTMGCWSELEHTQGTFLGFKYNANIS